MASEPNNILVLGGTGFVGSVLCEKLVRRGGGSGRIAVPSRRVACAKHLQLLPTVELIDADVHDDAQLARLVAGCDAVVNLVAILHGTQADFDHAHVSLAGKIARACKAAGVPRVVHVSALGAGAGAASMYQRSKAQGEAALAVGELELAILRPSVVFGEGDQFLNLFAKLQAVFPVMPLAGANTRFQPVWVEDVAQALIELVRRQAAGAFATGAASVFEACGPDVYTLRELVQLAGTLSGHRRPVMPLPAALGRLQAQMMEWLPGKTLMSRDNLDSMAVDNVASPGHAGLRELGIRASSLATIAPTYLRPAIDDVGSARRRSAGRF